MLYIIPTPIGHLQDLSFRAVTVLKQVDYILCEDTRHSQILLRHYQIQKPLKSFHKFSEAQKHKSILQDLQEGKNLALISDAGTPCICDPGQELIKSCHQLNIALDVLPGPCAVTTAFSASGFCSEGFTFRGFFPKKEKEQKERLVECYFHNLPTGFFEAPHRVLKTLQLIAKSFPKREVFMAKEMTKTHQKFFKTTASEILLQLSSDLLKGEFIFFLAPDPDPCFLEGKDLNSQVKSIEATFHLPKKEAIKLVAQLKGLCKKQVYQEVVDAEKS